MWHLSGLIYLLYLGVLYWNHYGSVWVNESKEEKKRDRLRYLSTQIFIFTLSACKSGLEKQSREAVNKRWWKWKMHPAWPIWFWQRHIQYGPTWQIIYPGTKIINPPLVQMFVILHEKDSLLHRIMHCTLIKVLNGFFLKGSGSTQNHLFMKNRSLKTGFIKGSKKMSMKTDYWNPWQILSSKVLCTIIKISQ